MKKIYLLLTFFIFTLPVLGQQFSWVKTGVESAHYYGTYLTSRHDLLATTSISADSFSFKGFNLMVNDTSGTLLWSKKFTGSFLSGAPAANIPAVAIDNNRNVILAGNFRSSLAFDTSRLTTPANNGTVMYLLKFNANGILQWHRQSVFTATKTVNQVNTHTDAAGNIYLTGSFTGTLTVGAITVTASGPRDGFVAKYNHNGSLLWLKSAGAAINANQIRSKVSPNGFIYLALAEPGTATIGGSNTLLLKSLDTNGNPRWSKTIAPAGNTTADLALDNSGNIYLAGNYTHSIDFTSTVSLTSILNYRTYLAKFDNNGNFKWAKDLATGNSFTSGPPAICFTSDKSLAITGNYTGTADFNNNVFTSSPAQARNGYIVKTDTSGAFLWTSTIPSAMGGSNDASGITSDPNGNIYISGNISGNANFSGSVQNVPNTRNFLAKLTANGGSLVTGVAYIDSNLNGFQDAGEPGLPGVFISTTTNASTNLTGPDGSYSLLLPNGTFSLIASPRKYYVINPVSQPITVSGPNREITNKDFAFRATPNKTDVAITLTNQAAARPGFNFFYNLSYKNEGTRDISDTITLQYDPTKLTYVGSITPLVSNVNGVIKWAYANLQPNERRSIQAAFIIPANIPLNAVLLANAIIKPIVTDEFPADNYDSTRVVVTGSYDPNDKQVNKPAISPAMAAAGEFLDYTIRFQNTGTDTAFTVIITDKIMEGLQLNTFEMLAASHPFKLSLKNNNLLEWRFDNILLPDSNRNEPGSHGFIRFRIKTKPGLLTGDSVRNKAAIYFDFNDPVITNYAVTRVVFNKTPHQDINLTLYPNPARNYVIIAADLKTYASAKVRLVNLLGQQLAEATLPANQQLHYKLPLNNLPKGVYIIQLETEAGRQTQRLVIQ